LSLWPLHVLGNDHLHRRTGRPANRHSFALETVAVAVGHASAECWWRLRAHTNASRHDVVWHLFLGALLVCTKCAGRLSQLPAVVVLTQLERQLSVCFERRDVVVVFVQQVLHLLLVHLRRMRGPGVVARSRRPSDEPSHNYECRPAKESHCPKVNDPCMNARGASIPTLSSTWCRSCASSIWRSRMIVSARCSANSRCVILQKASTLSWTPQKSMPATGQITLT
jgi:hypothetical protein